MKKPGLLLMLLFCILNAFAQTGDYKIKRRISIPGDGGWDYLIVDDSTNHLFISHSTVVQVVNILDGSVVATIPDLKGVHGIALAHEFNKGFITNGKDSSVTVFDLTTFASVNKIKLNGANPDALIYDPFSKRVFIFNGRSNNASVIDAKTEHLFENIALDGKPEAAVCDGKGMIYVNIEDKSEISAINATSMKVEKTWSIEPGEEPSGLAFDAKNQILFSVCDNQKMVMSDAFQGKVVANVSIGEHCDGAAFDPELRRAYSSNGDGTLTVVEEKSGDIFDVVQNVPTQKGARTIALSNRTHRLYLSTAEYGDKPEKTAENPHPRPSIIPGTFVVLEIGR